MIRDKIKLMKMLGLSSLLSCAVAASAGAGQAPSNKALKAAGLNSSVVATAVPSANDARSQAEMTARADHKAVFLVFHASWCIWCKRLDAMMDDPTVKPVWDKYFVTVHIDGLENAAQKNQENSGWETMLDFYKGKGSGIPYFVFLGPSGGVLADSRDPANMGYPAGAKDESAFLGDVIRATPAITSAEVKVLKDYLEKNNYGQP